MKYLKDLQDLNKEEIPAYGNDLQDPVVVNRRFLQQLIDSIPSQSEAQAVLKLSLKLRNLADNDSNPMNVAMTEIDKWLDWHQTIREFEEDQAVAMDAEEYKESVGRIDLEDTTFG